MSAALAQRAQSVTPRALALPLALLLLLTAALATLGVPLVRAQTADTEASAPSVVLVPTATEGVDPAVARFVDRALRHGAEARGYAVIEEPPATPPVSQSLIALWKLVHARQAEHALQARARAQDGRYVVELRIASRDGSGPHRGTVTAGQRDLEAAVAGLGQRTLPPPPSPGATPVPAAAGPAAKARPVRKAPPAPPRAAPPAPEKGRFSTEPPSFRLALRDEVVLGLGEDDFTGVVAGLGADYRLGSTLWVGGRLAYANLPGHDERTEASLWYLQLEQRATLGSTLAVPLRLGLGYLAANGSVLRLSAGLAFDIGRGVGIQLDLLAPTWWVTPDRTLFSLSLGLEVSLLI